MNCVVCETKGVSLFCVQVVVCETKAVSLFCMQVVVFSVMFLDTLPNIWMLQWLILEYLTDCVLCRSVVLYTMQKSPKGN